MQERRTAKRVRPNLNGRWEALTTQGRGAVWDLSSTGCFVLAGGTVSRGELIRLEIQFQQEVADLWGEVVYAVPEIGFALRLMFAGEDDRHSLQRLIDNRTETNERAE